MNENIFHPLIPVFDDTTEYRHVSSDFVETVFVGDREVLKIDSEGIINNFSEGDTSVFRKYFSNGNKSQGFC